MRERSDELTLRLRGLLESAEHRVEAAGEPAELVLPSGVDALGQVAGLGYVLGRLRQTRDRRDRRARHEQAQRRRYSPPTGSQEECRCRS
jgi:hypothetical protein